MTADQPTAKRFAGAFRALLSAAILFPTIPLPARSAEAKLKTLTVCDDVQDPASLNPYQVFSEKNHTLIQQFLEGLVRFGPNGEFEPALAESWERMDPLTMRFHLRKGVSFHNGEPFTAHAVKFSLEKYVAPDTQYPGLGFVGTIASVQVVDDHTVDVKTHIPDGLLLNRLAAWIHIVPPAYYQKTGPAGFATNPVGTGPFMFERWETGKQIVLNRNPNYWMPNFPKMDVLTFRFIPHVEQVDALLAGKIDMLTELPGTRTLDVAENPNTKVVKRYTFNTLVTSFRTQSGPLSDIRVRRALNYAINREDLIRYDIFGNGQVLATVTMPGEEGHNASLQPYPLDTAKAKELLKQAGHAGGLELEAIVKEQGRRTMGIIKANLEDVGVNLKVTYTDDANILKDIASRQWDMVFGACSDPMVHSFFIQSVIMYSKSPFSLMKDPVYDQKLEEVMTTLDDKKRVALAQALDKYVYDQALSIFTYQRVRTYGVNMTVDFVPYVSGMSYFFRTRIKSPKEINRDKKAEFFQ